MKTLRGVATLILSLGLTVPVIGQNAGQGQNAPATTKQNEQKQDSTLQQERREARTTEWMQDEIRHRIVMLPYYSMFDNLSFKVEGNKVTLMGQVTRPTLKQDAESAVKKVEGVTEVDNQIEVLPNSPADERIRLAVYRAVFSDSGLFRYSLQAVPSIHIIVENGHVTLEGVVANEAEKNLAGIKANSVPGIFSVKNNLRVE